MAFCVNCGAKLGEGARFCGKCGATAEDTADAPAICAKCGAELKSGTKFCVECGAAVGVAPSTSAVNNAAPRVPTRSSSARNAPDADDERPIENLSLFGYFIKCLKHYADFNGRARKKEFWGFTLFQGIFSTVLVVLGTVILGTLGMNGSESAAAVISWLVQLAFLIPNLAVMVRRLHDIGKNDKMLLWCLTIIGAIPVGIIVAFRDSAPGKNQYGRNPKGVGNGEPSYDSAEDDFVGVKPAPTLAIHAVVGVFFALSLTVNMALSVSGSNKAEKAYKLGLASSEEEKYDDAIVHYSEAIRLNPEFVLAYINRGAAYFNKEDYDNAIEDCSEAIRLEPMNPDIALAYHNRGSAYHNKGNYDQAISDFEQILRIDPNNVDAIANLEVSTKAKYTVVDSRDGKSYRTVRIGTQTWMAENLNYDVPNVKTDVCYRNKAELCDVAGRLYNWKTAKTACPAGYHLPTDAEWTTLVNYAGGEDIAGKKLKSTSGWNRNGNGTDDFGFSALSGGYGNSGNFKGVGDVGVWWSATGSNVDDAWHREMGYSYGSVSRFNDDKRLRFSVRCVEDDAAPVQSAAPAAAGNRGSQPTATAQSEGDKFIADYEKFVDEYISVMKNVMKGDAVAAPKFQQMTTEMTEWFEKIQRAKSKGILTEKRQMKRVEELTDKMSNEMLSGRMDRLFK